MVFASVSCSDDSQAKGSTTTQAEGVVGFAVGSASVDSPGAAIAFPDEVKQQLTKELNTWANAAVLRPLRTGKAGNVGDVFAATVSPRVADAGPDHGVFYETGLRATKPITVDTAVVNLTGLADPAGTVQMVNAQIGLGVKTSTENGAVTINRLGDLVFLPTPSGWQVAYYHLGVTRAGKGLGPAAGTATASTGKSGS